MLARPSIVAVLALAAIAAHLAPARAGAITYTQSVVATGSLGEVDFRDALVTFTQTADTSDVFTFGPATDFAVRPWVVQAVTSTVSVPGVGSASFTDPTNVLITTAPGFYLSEGIAGQTSLAILGQNYPPLRWYELKIGIMPMSPGSDPVTINGGHTFSTTAGGFQMTSTLGSTTFSAELANVPEPSSLATAGLFLAGVVGRGLRRKLRARLGGRA